MNKRLIIANWKMSPQSLEEAKGILDSVNDYLASLGAEAEFSLVFCPPFVFTEEVDKILRVMDLGHISSLGAQDIATEDKAALTGEVSGPMLVKLGVKYVIVGHSERRWKLGESDDMVNKKLKAVLRNGMVPVVCIGERVRDENFADFLKRQITNTFAGLTADEVSRCPIAYEPVWAISTNPGAHPDTPESALESIGIIKEILAKTYSPDTSNLFLYGGSVNSGNIAGFLGDKFDGVLVGGASVDKEEFIRLLSVVSKPQK